MGDERHRIAHLRAVCQQVEGSIGAVCDDHQDAVGQPAALNRLAQAHDDGRIRRDKGCEQQRYEDAAEGQTRPGGTIEHAVIGLQLGFLTQPHHAQG